ncbi:unnamed protein product [Echinostoma caproni]|uniref:PAW domain-containing protein n=1 Tax=Echinostoma caproni TaxID=27848 RepID=A0A183B7I8_9TREM|nr:unnamed protein product [Echinostoma caproni]
MVYLAREEGSPAEHDGCIEWVLDLNETEYSVGKVSLFASMVCHSAESHAQITLCSSRRRETNKEHDAGDTRTETQIDEASGGACVRVTPGSNGLFQMTDFVGAKTLRLSVRLWSDSSSALAWQKSQLFRQKDTDYVLWPLEWNVELIHDEKTE